MSNVDNSNKFKEAIDIEVKEANVKEANVKEATVVEINKLLDKKDKADEIIQNDRNKDIKQKKICKKPMWIGALVSLVLIIIGAYYIQRQNIKYAQAGAAIGNVNKIDINVHAKAGDLNHFGMSHPILYITLDKNSQGLPAGFDDDGDPVEAAHKLSELAKSSPNWYGAFVPSMDDSSIVFFPYYSVQRLRSLGYIGGTSVSTLRNACTLMKSEGAGSGKLQVREGTYKSVIQTTPVDIATESDLKRELGNNIFQDGIYYKKLTEKGFEPTKWENLEKLVTSENITKSLKLWGYFTYFDKEVFDITPRVNKYIGYGEGKDDIEKAYRTLDLLLTIYSIAKGSPAEKEWKTAITNYVTNKNVTKDGASKNTNILIHTGVIYNIYDEKSKTRELILMSHMDAINFTMGLTKNGDMTDKNVAPEIMKMKLSKGVAGLQANNQNFNHRLREAYGISVQEAPNATRTAWSGASVYYGSTLVNYILEKRPKKNDWKVLEDRPYPYIRRLYVPIYSKSGSLYKTTYGMNVIMVSPWVSQPQLSLKAEVVWSKEDTKPSKRKYKVPLEQATVNQSATIQLKFSTKSISAWNAIASKYKKAAVALVKVNRTMEQKLSDTSQKKSAESKMKLQVIKKEGSNPVNYNLGDFIQIGTAEDFLNMLTQKDTTLNIFSDAGHIAQELTKTEQIKQTYDFEVQVMLYNGSLSNPTESYIYGDREPEKTEELVYKGKSTADKKKLTVEAYKKDDPDPVDPDEIEENNEPDVKNYEYVQYISEPLAYAEIKEGTVNLNGTNSIENYEAMAGVPSTEKLYFTSGGSEFIVEIYMQRIEGEESLRKYTSFFKANTNGSEFKDTDSLKGGTGKYTRTETFVADGNGKTTSKTVVAEQAEIATPTGATSYNISVNSHNSSTVIWAEWSGTIANNTPEPEDIGEFDPGKPGSPCPGQGYDKGKQRKKAEPETNWDVSSYNTAIDQAIAWAKAMEDTNENFTVRRIADSDGQIRQFLIGDAVITVTMTGGSNGHSHTQLPSFSKNGTYTSSNADNAKVESDDKEVLGSGWGWTDGNFATGGYSGCCEHGGTPHKEWDVEPKPAVPPSYDDEGNMIDPGSPAVEGVPHQYNHSDWFTPGTDITQSASANIDYTIKVTFKNSKLKSGGNYDGARTLNEVEITTNGTIPAHALCGPDCQRNTLPAVYDTWVQKLKYDYLRINAVKVYKISRSYINGMEDITFEEVENVKTNIKRGDPNIFYNIAEECTTYSSDSPQTPSLAGRIRYSLQSQQHDEVIWQERSTAGDMRTRKSDGMAKTVSNNPVPSGGTGHQDQPWATGILYNNKDGFTDDEKWFDKIYISGLKSGYTADSIDRVDKQTEEWKRFDARRKTKNTAVVISDMLILQTSTGDQSVIYFTKEQTKTAQEHYGQDGELSATISEMWYNNPNSAAKWATTAINIGGYTGKYATPSNKFSSGAREFKTIFDNDGSDYDVSIAHPDPDATVAGPKTYTTVANVVNALNPDNYKSSPAKMQRRMSRVSLLKIVEDNIQINPTIPNREYITGDAYQFYQPILEYVRGTYEDSNLANYKFEYESEYDDVLGYEGYPVDAVYGPGFDKVNDIVIHTPVSVQNATIVALDKSRDQRTNLTLSAAENLIKSANQLDYCPGTPELCDYRYLNCKYFEDVTLLSLNFNPTSTVVTVDEKGNTNIKEIQTVKENIDEDGTKTISVVDTVNLREYELPAGFEIDKTNRFGTGDSLKAYGTRFSIPLSDLGLDYKPSTKIKVEMNFYMPDGLGNTMIVSFFGYDFYIPDGNRGTWNTGNAWERRVDGVDFSGTPMRLAFIFSMYDINECELYVNGIKIEDYTIVNSSREINAELVGEYINIGSWNRDDIYPAHFYIDNLVITKLAGSHTHTAACYTNVYNHQKFTNYNCQVPVTFNYKGEPEVFTAPVSGWYKLEAWGAAGGGGSLNQLKSSHGGLGGYATGKVYLNKGQQVLITVGGQGTKSTALGTGGGYNGGGHGGPSGYGGGGATDIVIETTSIKGLLSDNQLNINNWEKIYPGGHSTISYSNREGSFQLTTHGSYWEHYYIPVATTNGATYEFSFQYRTGRGSYRTLSSKDALYVSATKVKPSNTDTVESNVLGKVAITRVNATTYSTYSFTFKGTGGIVYLDFNFGCLLDGITDTIYIKDMRLINKDNPGDVEGGSGVYTTSNGVTKNSTTIQGPYISAPAGTYRVTVLGSGLTGATIKAGTSSGLNFTVHDTTVTNTQVVFYADITKDIIKGVDGTGLYFTISDIQSSSTFSKMIVTRLEDRVIVAGGGGGADNDGGDKPIGGVDDGSGGHGGGLVGGNAYIDGVEKAYTGGGTITDVSDINKWRVMTGNLTWDAKEQAFKATGTTYIYLKPEYAHRIDPSKTYTIKVTMKVANFDNKTFYWGGERLNANRQHLEGYGGTYDYSAAVAIKASNTDWVTYTATKTGTTAGYAGWGTDTVYYALGGLLNYSDHWVDTPQITWVKNIELYENGVLVQSMRGPGDGKGESATSAVDTGGGGGGYYGGKVTNHNNGGGGGGSSYIGGVENGATVGGVNYGNGKVRITLLDHVHTADCTKSTTDFNVHVHNKNCITTDSAELVNALRMLEQGDDSLIKTLLGTTVYNAIKANTSIVYTWSGWSATDYKQFRALHNVKFSVNSSGNLVVTSTGTDPFFDVPVNIKAESVEKVRVYCRLVNTTSAYSAIHFTNAQYTSYTSGIGVQTNINANNNWQWIEFNVASHSAWKGTITGLRFDIVGDNNANGYVEVNKIELVGSGSASAGTATTVLQTYDNFTANTRQFGITNPGSTATLSFSGGNIVLNGRMNGWEINLPVEIDNGKALQFVRLNLVNQTPATTAEIRLNGNDSYRVSANITANSTATQVAVFKVPEYTGKITSIQFSITDHASGGSAKISKIELIGYGKRTADPTESFVNGEYDAHIHTQDCIYEYGETSVVYAPVTLTTYHNTFNGGFNSNDWNEYTTVTGSPQRMYNGTNLITLTSPINKYSYVYIKLSVACLTYSGEYSEFKVRVNGTTWMTIEQAVNAGYLHNPRVEPYSTQYTPHPFPEKLLTGESTGRCVWNGLILTFYTKDATIDQISLYAYYPSYGLTRPGDGIWVHSGSLNHTIKEGGWTYCTGELNTYSDLVTEVTPVKRTGDSGSKTFEYTGSMQTFTAPITGKYTLEVWGAQGGTCGGTQGGLGGYSKGNISLTQGQEIYVYVGGSGSQRNGGWNGGGSGGIGTRSNIHGGGGGGATDIRVGGITLDKRVIVAGGGGGAGGDGQGGSPSGTISSGTGGVPGTGGGVTGTNGEQGTSTQAQSGYGGTGATATSGGYGGVATTTYYSKTDGTYHTAGGGGGGGGYYGGGGGAGGSRGGTSSYIGSRGADGSLGQGGNGGNGATSGPGYFAGSGGGGGGGSGYVGGVENGTTQNGVRSGNGMAKITWWGETYYTGPDYVAPPNRQKYTYTPVKIAYSTPTAVSTLTAITFGSLNGTYEGIVATINTISNYYNQIPQTIGGRLNPIFSCQEVPNVHQCVDACKIPNRILTCNEPHHYGAHYDGSNPICWSACKNDNNHKAHRTEVKGTDGSTIRSATFINTDYEFTVYFPNTGDFYQSNLHGISNTTSIRGIGYVDNMDTTKWIREKRVMFTFDVLYCNNGTWEQYRAGEWIELPVTGDTYPYYHFYCTLNNNERASAEVYYEVEAINAHPSPGGKNDIYRRDTDRNNDNFLYETNKNRFINLTAYHGAYKSTYVDLVGRIGNLLISDTDDMRFSNFFKTIIIDEWLVKGIINKVYEGDQARYLSWHSNEGQLMTDVRGVKVTKETGMYNVWGTQKWTEKAEANPLPLSAEKNNIAQLQNDPLKPGYDVLFEITTIGDYYNVGLQILPYFYALNTITGDLIPVDVWMKTNEEYRAINIHKLSESQYYWDIFSNNDINAIGSITDPNWIAFKGSGLYNYIMNLDWVNEQERRNYDMDEHVITERVAKTYVEHVFNGTETVDKLVDTPLGNSYALGTLQLLTPKGKARTFIGTEYTNTVNINGGKFTNLKNAAEVEEFNVHAQRWHLKLGLPASVVFTRYNGTKHLHPTELINKNGNLIQAKDELVGEGWVVLMTADIKAIGTTWTLQYSQGVNNGVITVGGKKIVLPSTIPTVLAVYDTEASSSIDVDTIGTH